MGELNGFREGSGEVGGDSRWPREQEIPEGKELVEPREVIEKIIEREAAENRPEADDLDAILFMRLGEVSSKEHGDLHRPLEGYIREGEEFDDSQNLLEEIILSQNEKTYPENGELGAVLFRGILDGSAYSGIAAIPLASVSYVEVTQEVAQEGIIDLALGVIVDGVVGAFLGTIAGSFAISLIRGRQERRRDKEDPFEGYERVTSDIVGVQMPEHWKLGKIVYRDQHDSTVELSRDTSLEKLRSIGGMQLDGFPNPFHVYYDAEIVCGSRPGCWVLRAETQGRSWKWCDGRWFELL